MLKFGHVLFLICNILAAIKILRRIGFGRPIALLALLKTTLAVQFITIFVLLDHSLVDGAYTNALVRFPINQLCYGFGLNLRLLGTEFVTRDLVQNIIFLSEVSGF